MASSVTAKKYRIELTLKGRDEVLVVNNVSETDAKTAIEIFSFDQTRWQFPVEGGVALFVNPAEVQTLKVLKS